MTRRAIAVLVTLALIAAAAAACGRYGPPRRPARASSAPAPATVPVTDPAVPR
jgi:predicted small lipoprotein YifL